MMVPTYGERLLVLRRRGNETVIEAARRHGVSPHRYRALELAERCPHGAPAAPVRALKVHEVCRLRRRRAGMSLSEAAEGVGVSKWWLTQMEAGRQKTDRLEAFWAEQPVLA